MSADNDFRDALIEVIEPIAIKAADAMGWADPEEIADAVIALLARWTAKEPE